MLLDAPAVRPRIRDDQATHDAANAPPESDCDASGEALLLVDLCERALGVVDAGLELADQQRAGGWIEGQVVDAPPVAEMVVRHLLPR